MALNKFHIERAVASMLSELTPDSDAEAEENISVAQELIDKFTEMIHGIPGLGYMTRQEMIMATSVVLSEMEESDVAMALALLLVDGVRLSRGAAD